MSDLPRRESGPGSPVASMSVSGERQRLTLPQRSAARWRLDPLDSGVVELEARAHVAALGPCHPQRSMLDHRGSRRDVAVDPNRNGEITARPVCTDAHESERMHAVADTGR